MYTLPQTERVITLAYMYMLGKRKETTLKKMNEIKIPRMMHVLVMGIQLENASRI